LHRRSASRRSASHSSLIREGSLISIPIPINLGGPVPDSRRCWLRGLRHTGHTRAQQPRSHASTHQDARCEDLCTEGQEARPRRITDDVIHGPAKRPGSAQAPRSTAECTEQGATRWECGEREEKLNPSSEWPRDAELYNASATVGWSLRGMPMPLSSLFVLGGARGLKGAALLLRPQVARTDLTLLPLANTEVRTHFHKGFSDKKHANPKRVP